MTQGTQYAVVVSRPPEFGLQLDLEGSDCEGDFFVASTTGAFSPHFVPIDMIVTVLVG